MAAMPRLSFSYYYTFDLWLSFIFPDLFVTYTTWTHPEEHFFIWKPTSTTTAPCPFLKAVSLSHFLRPSLSTLLSVSFYAPPIVCPFRSFASAQYYIFDALLSLYEKQATTASYGYCRANRFTFFQDEKENSHEISTLISSPCSVFTLTTAMEGDSTRNAFGSYNNFYAKRKMLLWGTIPCFAFMI